MLRITHGAPGDLLTFCLEGQVAGAWVDELRRTYGDTRRTTRGPVTFDLQNVTFIDAEGLAFFDEIFPDVTFINCSLFAEEQLRTLAARHRVQS